MKTLMLLFSLITANTTLAAVEYRQFANAEQQQSYQSLISELRCLVCQNQTIADSNADLAQDLRRQVYEMLQQGKSKQEIADFMTARYGDFVLYNPPFKAKTGILWLAPVVFLLIGLMAVFLIVRRKRTVSAELSPEKKAKIRRLLDKSDAS